MGDECTGISVINEGSNFGGQCWFRKGNLRYINDYSECFNAECQKRSSTSDNTIRMTTPEPASNDTRLPMCDDTDTMTSVDCTTDEKLARPKKVPAPAPAPPTVDEVVDKRDCFVKYLWFLPSS